ncbi:hypothetical protein [Lentimicrobium sp.]|uniref:hypothetical protein n=1 Tax=Lentimicrobium sp. TaxID=2034841 RepID=UPI00345EB777
MGVKELLDSLNKALVEQDMRNLDGVKAVTANTTLTKDDSGKLITISKADGATITLPSAEAGLRFVFLVITSVTSNAYAIATAATDELFAGGPVTVVAAGGNSGVFPADRSNDDTFSMNGSTTGGLAGTLIEMKCVEETDGTLWWLVTGVNAGSGTIATSFA